MTSKYLFEGKKIQHTAEEIYSCNAYIKKELFQINNVNFYIKKIEKSELNPKEAGESTQ